MIRRCQPIWPVLAYIRIMDDGSQFILYTISLSNFWPVSFRIVDDGSYQSSLSNHQLDEMQLCFSPIEIFSLWLDFTYLSTLIKYVFPQIWIVNFIFFTLGARKSYFNPIWNWVTLKLHQQGANSGQFEELDKPTNWTLLSEHGGLVRSWINCWEKEYSRLYFWGQKMDTMTLTPADPWLIGQYIQNTTEGNMAQLSHIKYCPSWNQ